MKIIKIIKKHINSTISFLINFEIPVNTTVSNQKTISHVFTNDELFWILKED